MKSLFEYYDAIQQNSAMEVNLDNVSEEARKLDRLARKASREAIAELWSKGISVTVLEGEDIVEIAPDGTKKFIKKLDA